MITEVRKVAYVRSAGASYPPTPFSPGEVYPEYPFPGTEQGPNPVYAMVRTCFRFLGLDAENFGTARWDPLGELVKPGDTVIVKPNWVQHINAGPGTLDSVVTHPAVVRPILDYLFIALGGVGTVVVGDAPIQQCRFETLMSAYDWHGIPRFFADKGNMQVKLEDWRLEIFDTATPFTFRKLRREDETRFSIVDVGPDSMLEPVSWDWDNFRVTGYDPEALKGHHRPGKHEYCISNRVLEADVIFNVPKLKSHAKAGMTCCLKNMVGINGHKSYLPHHRQGPTSEGHDEYPRAGLLKALHSRLSQLRDTATTGWGQAALWPAVQVAALPIRLGRGIHEGSWYGNDTLWRTILDLNRIALYADKTGRLQDSPQRKIFSIVDAVVAGDGGGPLAPNDVQCGVVLAGADPLAVDMAAAHMVGFSWEHLPQLKYGLNLTSFPLFAGDPAEIRIVGEEEVALFAWRSPVASFRPSNGWGQVL